MSPASQAAAASDTQQMHYTAKHRDLKKKQKNITLQVCYSNEIQLRSFVKQQTQQRLYLITTYIKCSICESQKRIYWCWQTSAWRIININICILKRIWLQLANIIVYSFWFGFLLWGFLIKFFLVLHGVSSWTHVKEFHPRLHDGSDGSCWWTHGVQLLLSQQRCAWYRKHKRQRGNGYIPAQIFRLCMHFGSEI